jgi:hypothetical protein
MLTTDLRAMPWLSGDFYTTRFPQQAARNAIFYLGYTLVHRDHEAEGVTGSISAKMALISRRRPMDFATLNQQSYYAAVFHGPDALRVPTHGPAMCQHAPRRGRRRPAAPPAPGRSARS